MLCGIVIMLLTLPYISSHPTEYILPSPDKYGVFIAFSNTASFLASSLSYPSSDTFPRPPSLNTLPMIFFYRTYNLPIKTPLCSFPNWLHCNSLYSLYFAFVVSCIKPSRRRSACFSCYLEVTFWEQLVWYDFLNE